MGLLRELGYSNLRHYHGGITDWTESGCPVESAASPSLVTEPLSDVGAMSPRTPRPQRVNVAHERQWGSMLLDVIDRQSTSRLFLGWLAMVLCCGGLYWLVSLAGHGGLVAGQGPIDANAGGFATAIYFSFVTALSVGYGDVVPVGAMRIVAIAEAVTGLLIFGAVVAKFVSRRQDELVREIFRVTFEERLDRVQTNLHLVLSELQAIAAMCDDGAVRAERIGTRLESAALVFAGELRAIHDLLYRPQQMPEEQVLGAILASLSSSFHELSGLLLCIPPGMARSPIFSATLGTMARLANEICGECVPRVYAPALTLWMDRIQETAHEIERGGPAPGTPTSVSRQSSQSSGPERR